MTYATTTTQGRPLLLLLVLLLLPLLLVLLVLVVLVVPVVFPPEDLAPALRECQVQRAVGRYGAHALAERYLGGSSWLSAASD